MGFFDQLTNLSPEQNQGLLAAASQILQQSGPSRMPTSFGQILGGGMQAFQGGVSDAQKRKLEELLGQQTTQMNAYKLRDAESDFANQEAQRQRAEQLRQFYIKQGAGAQPDAIQTPAAMGNNLTPTTQNASVMQQMQGQAAPAGGEQRQGVYQQRLALAQQLRNAGFSQEADAQEAAALKFQPKVKQWSEVRVGDRVLYAPYFEDGTSGSPVTLEVAKQLEKVNTGGSTELVDAYTGKSMRSLKNTQTPDSIASNAVTMRGQNMTDARARDLNQITAGQKNEVRDQRIRDENLAKQAQVASFDTMLGTLDRLKAHPGLPRSVGLYSATPTIPGSDSANFQTELETFKSQAFIPAVAQLKGMGALSDAEGKKLSASVGALDPKMSEKEFKRSIDRITAEMNAARDRVVSSSRQSVQQGMQPAAAGGVKFLGFE